MHARLLVAVDDGTPSAHALQEAACLAVALASTLRLVHVVDIDALHADDGSLSGADAIEQARREDARAQLATAASAVHAHGARVETSLREKDGGVSAAILAEAAAWRH